MQLHYYLVQQWPGRPAGLAGWPFSIVRLRSFLESRCAVMMWLCQDGTPPPRYQRCECRADACLAFNQVCQCHLSSSQLFLLFFLHFFPLCDDE